MSTHLEISDLSSVNCSDFEENVNNDESHSNMEDSNLLNAENFQCHFEQEPSDLNLNRTKEKRQLISAIILCFVFMIAELSGGYLSGSLAIMTDAAHLLSDCISFLVSLIAVYYTNKAPDSKMSFGYKRVEIIGALMSIFGIWILTTVLVILAIQRLIQKDFVIDADTMILVSLAGVVINIVIGFVLHGSCVGHNHHHGHSHCSQHTSPLLSRKKVICTDKFKTCDEKKCENTLLLPPSPYLSPSLTPVFSNASSRHNSFSIHSDKQKVEHVLNAAQIILKKQTRQRQRFSSDDGDLQLRLSPPEQTNNFKYSKFRHESEDNSTFTSTSNLAVTEPIKNINIRAAIIHVIGDFVQSIGVLLAAIIIKYHPELKYFDPICTFLFSFIVLLTTVRIFKDVIRILLEAVPQNVKIEKLKEELSYIESVKSVHNLNVWSLTNDWNIMSCHVVIDPLVNDTNEILNTAKNIARNGFNIKTSTIQIENLYFDNSNFIVNSIDN